MLFVFCGWRTCRVPQQPRCLTFNIVFKVAVFLHGVNRNRQDGQPSVAEPERSEGNRSQVRIAIGAAKQRSVDTKQKNGCKTNFASRFFVCIVANLTNFDTKNGGVNRNRTDLSDFADRCLTSWLSRLVTVT